MLLGHAREEVVSAVQEAATAPSNYYVLNDKGIHLAEMLVDAIPCAAQIKYCLSGSDATFYAMRLARAYTGRTKVLKFEGGYIGAHDYALMSTTPKKNRPFPTAEPDSAGIPPVLEDQVLIAPFNNTTTTTELIRTYKDELAAVIVEADHRNISPKPGFLQGLRQLTKELGILLIFDEVVTGFRLGYGGAQEYYGVTPDLAAYGKVIGGGLPLAAVAGGTDIMSLASAHTNRVFMSSTLSGNIVAASAGIATLKVLQQSGVYERLFQLGERFRSGASEVLVRRGIEGTVLGTGPSARIVIGSDKVTDYRSSIADKTGLLKKILRNVVTRRVITHGKFYFSLSHSDDDIDRVIEILDQSVEAALRS